MQPQTLSDGTVLDPKVLKVARAIKQIEGGDYNNYTGDGGSSAGAFQWNNNKIPLQPGQLPARFIDHAREAGVQVNDFSPASQNKVAYSIMKKWKDEGLQPEEIAAKWNGAKKDSTTGRLTYNNPEYGAKFRQALMGQSAPGGTYAPPPPRQEFQPVPVEGSINLQAKLQDPNSFAGGLSQDLKNTGENVRSAYSKSVSGEINPLSGILQGTGAIAGGVGDVLDTSIKALPLVGSVYKGAEDLIGGAVQGVANTDIGQSIGNAYKQLSPEMRGNIEATANIASLVPLFKGFTSIKNAGVDAVTHLYEDKVTSQAVKELEDSLGSSKAAANLVEDGTVKRIVESRNLPEVIETGPGVYTYNVDNAMEKVNKQMDEILKKQDKLAQEQKFEFKSNELGKYTQLGDSRKISAPVQDSLDALKKHYDSVYDQTGQLWVQQAFNKLQNGQFAMDDIKELARKVGQAKSSYLASGDLSSAIPKQAWENLRRDLKEVMGTRDISDTLRPLDKKYSELANEKKALIKLKNKRVKPKKEGLIKRGLRELPLSSLILPKNPRTATGRLYNKRPIRQTVKSGVYQMAKGMALSNQQQSTKSQ